MSEYRLAKNPRDAIFLAREAFEELPKEPMKCEGYCDSLEDAMLDFQITWKILGIDPDEYSKRAENAAIICANELFRQIKTSANKTDWITKFDKVMRRFHLSFESVGIKETDYLRQRRWNARMRPTTEPTGHLATVTHIGVRHETHA